MGVSGANLIAHASHLVVLGNNILGAYFSFKDGNP